MDSLFSRDIEMKLDKATHYLKVLANRNRLFIMCKITHKPHSVSELTALTGMSQTALSHQLAKLRKDGMVSTERKGKEIYYAIANQHLADLIKHICKQFQYKENEK